jgi:hypothetical protein
MKSAMSTTIDEILSEASRLEVGIALAPDGALELFPADRVPLDLLSTIREHNAELRAFLEVNAPLLHAAKQVCCGEFDGCDAATRRKLTKGLRAIPHPQCRKAIGHLRTK